MIKYKLKRKCLNNELKLKNNLKYKLIFIYVHDETPTMKKVVRDNDMVIIFDDNLNWLDSVLPLMCGSLI
jgi:hypothetical protein